jgi:hypothetical protein
MELISSRAMVLDALMSSSSLLDVNITSGPAGPLSLST